VSPSSRDQVPGVRPATITLAIGLIFASVGKLDAYTDPGSGALFLQVLSAGAVGALFYWRKITTWVKRRMVSGKDQPGR
jgi:hypothetical protein